MYVYISLLPINYSLGVIRDLRKSVPQGYCNILFSFFFLQCLYCFRWLKLFHSGLSCRGFKTLCPWYFAQLCFVYPSLLCLSLLRLSQALPCSQRTICCWVCVKASSPGLSFGPAKISAPLTHLLLA